jgi:hypothetical protein
MIVDSSLSLFNIPPSLIHWLYTTIIAVCAGFMNGVVSCKLPEVYHKDMAPRIRREVQDNFTSTDPYSPLTLTVPHGLSPPWKDCFVEEQRDVIHGGVIMKTLIQNSKLKQCSRCRCWTVVPDGLQSATTPTATETSPAALTTHPVMMWRQNWSISCICGGPWTLRVPTIIPGKTT